MHLDFIKLSKAQADLDKHISEEKDIKHADFIKEKAIALCVEFGELLNERPFIFKYWSNKTGDRQKAIVEYVDGLHFLLSYGNAIEFDFSKYEYRRPKEMDQRDIILGLFSIFSNLPYIKQFEDALTYYLMLGENLNFTAEEIETAYHEKNRINHKRQDNSY